MSSFPVSSRLASRLCFFREYCRNVKATGSLGPDSSACVDALLRRIRFDTATVIVEFGAASGSVTREIVRRKRPDTRLIAFEKNPRMHALLKDQLTGTNVHLVHGDVFDSPRILQAEFGLGRGSVDGLVSTLPWSWLDFDALVEGAVLPLLQQHGQFVQYAHVVTLLRGLSLRRRLQRHFPCLQSDLVWLNLPPALVYTCTME